MVLRERAWVIVELIVAATATALLALVPAAPARVEPSVLRVDVPSDTPAIQVRTTAQIDPNADAIARADALYRDEHFMAAANVLRATHDPTLEPLAELYAELARTFDLGTVRVLPYNERFEALVVARRLDLALGGAFADKLVTSLADVAPKTAIYYVAYGDLEHAQLAVQTAENVGKGDDDNIKAVRRHLARSRTHR
jgi:hypothetical protein